MTVLALEIIGHLEIPGAVLQHRFVREGLSLIEIAEGREDERQRVVGTDPDRSRVQLYGWARISSPTLTTTGTSMGYV